MDKISSDSFELISNALSIEHSGETEFNEEDMIIQIERRVAELMQEDFGLLMSYLYRLDVPEHKIERCLKSIDPDIHPYTCLANLIWNRQKARMVTKKRYRQDKNIEEGWEW